MPAATTGKNLPYPLGTDRVMDGDDQIRKLAQSVDNMIQTGTATVNVVTGGAASTLAVTFPIPYSAAPVVCASAQGASQNVGANSSAATTTGFTVAAWRATAGSQSVSWIAAGPVVAVS